MSTVVVPANTTKQVYGGSADIYVLHRGSVLVLNGGTYTGAVTAAEPGVGTLRMVGSVTIACAIGSPTHSLGSMEMG